ncbi:MAG: hypothetical protein JWN13_3928 [Betaproteobacteria bacterium]|nr:hypothetical protein [Betaproteobacteria bacterium]
MTRCPPQETHTWSSICARPGGRVDHLPSAVRIGLSRLFRVERYEVFPSSIMDVVAFLAQRLYRS